MKPINILPILAATVAIDDYIYTKKLKSKTIATINTPLSLDCIIYDKRPNIPNLSYSWFYNRKPILSTDNTRFDISPIYSLPNIPSSDKAKVYGSTLTLNFLTLADDGTYACQAIDPETNKKHTTRTQLSVVFDFNPSSNLFPSSSNERCELYQGSLCAPYLRDSYIKVSDHLSQEEIELEVQSLVATFQTLVDPKSSNCSSWLVPATCFYVFDTCINQDPNNLKKLCRQDCELLVHHECKSAFHKLIKNPSQTQVSDMLSCKNLKKSNDQRCLPTGMPTHQNDQMCYETSLQGMSVIDTVVRQSEANTIYYGQAATSENGHACLPWENDKLLALYPKQLAGGHNYCRAIQPAGLIYTNDQTLGSSPWCMTSHGPQKCNIPSCSPLTAAVANKLYIIVPSVILGTFVVVLACFLFCCYKSSCSPRNPADKRVPDATVAGSFIHQPISPNVMNTPMKSPPIFDDTSRSHNSSQGQHHLLNSNSTVLSSQNMCSIFELNYQAVAKMCEIGDGNFGKVFLARINPNSHPVYSPRQPVLVKTLENEGNNIDECLEQEFLKELQNRADLQHANLIGLKAYCRVPGKYCCLVYEYTEFSTLHKALVAGRLGVGATGVPSNLSVGHFPYIVRQIVDVMAFLEDKGYTHRDLAARNIMIMNNNFKIKVASLGMMRRDYITDYAKLPWLTKLPFAMPLRWMAPESLEKGEFSIASDVYSFGIVLWEIFSFGERPWPNFSNDNVLELVSKQNQLPQPQSCSPALYSVIQECWSMRPTARPSFTQLKDTFMSNQFFDSYTTQNSVVSQSYTNNIPSTPMGTQVQNSQLQYSPDAGVGEEEEQMGLMTEFRKRSGSQSGNKSHFSTYSTNYSHSPQQKKPMSEISTYQNMTTQVHV